ncbi:MAG TPA: proline/glycine betaine ABC transporter permease [Bacilli bacterium]
MELPKIPLGNWIEAAIEAITVNLEWLFNAITFLIEKFIDLQVTVFSFIHPFLFIALLALLAWKISGWKIGLLTLLGLLLIDDLGYWEQTIDTLALVITSVLISFVFGVPLGIWSAYSNTVKNIVTPILDLMQTMPAFVYLIPAIFFFGLGTVPGVFASVIFAMPPTIRLTNLGIRQVSRELVEAADAFGATSYQKLVKVQLPLALPTIMAGINQSIMLALSMVVIASMIGAPGLGASVYGAVTQLKIGTGFEAGLSIVMIAIILDRISQNIKLISRRK